MNTVQPIDLDALEQAAPTPAAPAAAAGIAPANIDETEGLSVQEQIARTGTYKGAPTEQGGRTLPAWLPANATDEEKALLDHPTMSLEELSFHARRGSIMIGRLITRVREGNHQIGHQVESAMAQMNERLTEALGMSELGALEGLYKVLTPIVQATARAKADKQMGRTVRLKFLTTPAEAGPEDKVVAVNVQDDGEGKFTLYVKARNDAGKMEDITGQFGPAVRLAISEQTAKAGYANGQYYWAVVNNLVYDPNGAELPGEHDHHDHHHH